MKTYTKLSLYLQINEQATKINKKIQAKKTFSVMFKPELKSFNVRKKIPKTTHFKTRLF